MQIACTLSSAGLAAQAGRWERLIARAMTECTQTADGLRRQAGGGEGTGDLHGAIVVVKVSLMSTPLSIGEVARLAGRRPSSIRYYEQIGLLPAATRVAGRRVYGPEVVRTLAVIETGQRAGLSLEEIRVLLAASPDDGAAVERLREVAERKLPEITALIERSQLVRDWLECAARCECPSLDQCPLFDDPAQLPAARGPLS